MTPAGFLYIAKGADYVGEAAASAAQLRRIDPLAEITLVATTPPDQAGMFSEVVVHADPREETMEIGHSYVLDRLAEHLPYERTVFLDTDTYALETLAPLHKLLAHCDVAVAPAPNGFFETAPAPRGQPLAAAEIYNSGVIALRRCAEVTDLLRAWRTRHLERRREGLGPWETDQRALSEALLTSSCRLQVLSPAWNFRIPFHQSVAGPVRLLHGRSRSPERIGEVLNSTVQNRAWDPHEEVVRPLDPDRVDGALARPLNEA